MSDHDNAKSCNQKVLNYLWTLLLALSNMTEALIQRCASNVRMFVRPLVVRLVSTDVMASDSTVHDNGVTTGHLPNRDCRTYSKVKKLKDMPGLNGYPIVGTLPEYFKKENHGKIYEMHERRHKLLGKMIREKLGPFTNVNLADADLVEELLRQDGKLPFRPPYEAWVEYNDLRGKKSGIMTAVDEEWNHIRRALSQNMLVPRHVFTRTEAVNGVVSSLVDRLRYTRDEDKSDLLVPQLSDILYRFSLEALVTVLLDTRLGCLDNDVEPRLQEFIHATSTMFETGQKMLVGAKIHRWLNTRWWKQHVQAWDTIIGVAKDLLDQKMAELRIELDANPSPGSELSGGGLLGHLLTNSSLSIQEIYVNISEMMGAGIDSMASTMGFAFYLLATNPESQQKAYDEVTSVLQGRICDQSDLSKLPYLKCIIKETLRLYPALPGNARILKNDIVLAGYEIPKGTCVVLNTYTMCRNEEYFTSANTFMPERWTRQTPNQHNNSETKPTCHPYGALPFGFGARSCVGRRVAELELSLALSRVIQQFHLKPHSTLYMNPTAKTVLIPGPQLNIIFEDR